MIEVLFVSSGNSKNGISSIVKNQGESLQSDKINVSYFTIKGKGLKGYFKSIFQLRNKLRSQKYDIIHAHYSLSAYVASLAGAKPIVVSLMGSDVNSSKYYKFIIKLFNQLFWSKIIVKSDKMLSLIRVKEVEVIPNGVDFELFKPMNKDQAVDKLGWNKFKKHICFAADPKRPEKNFKLAKEAFDLIGDKNLELHFLENIPNTKIPDYFNASDVILLTSLWEGSPNVIKEAMACNIPIVSTDVGDVKKVIGNTDGCFISKQNSIDLSQKIEMALNCISRTTGRDDINHLNAKFISNKIFKLYKFILSK